MFDEEQLKDLELVRRTHRAIFFIEESKRIEGIMEEPTSEEVAEFSRFMDLPELTVEDVERFVSVYQPGAELRVEKGRNVTVGNYHPPEGGPHILARLKHILYLISNKKVSPFAAHVMYESLHPFTDGNGRSGRMIWAWHMGWNRLELGFLHMFYYQSLQNINKYSVNLQVKQLKARVKELEDELASFATGVDEEG